MELWSPHQQSSQSATAHVVQCMWCTPPVFVFSTTLSQCSSDVIFFVSVLPCCSWTVNTLQNNECITLRLSFSCAQLRVHSHIAHVFSTCATSCHKFVTLRQPRYAAYTLSQTILGVAPFYRFTFAQPERVGVVAASPRGSVTVWGPPRFKHRCIFMNDEELLGFFRRDPLGEQVRANPSINVCYF